MPTYSVREISSGLCPDSIVLICRRDYLHLYPTLTWQFREFHRQAIRVGIVLVLSFRDSIWHKGEFN